MNSAEDGFDGIVPEVRGKRIFDIALASCVLVFMAPIILLVAAAIWCFDGRPILFRQARVGRGKKEFVMYKFRTMRLAPDGAGQSFNPGDRSRITQLGRLLRLTKLDELPQLWNVLRGEMSIVGPRPEVPQWVAVYPERWERILSVRPGLTDPAAILFRHEESVLAKAGDPERCYREEILAQKLFLSEKYVSEQSLKNDMVILLKTLWAVVR